MRLTNEIITTSAARMTTDGDHLFWAAKPEQQLLQSISEFGQTTPVLAQKTVDGMELITGYGRLAVLRELDQPVTVHLVEEADAIQKGLLYIADNAMRPLDDGMRLSALRYFARHMDDHQIRTEILPRLEIKPKSKDAKLLMTWLELPEDWQNHLAHGNAPLAAGPALARMDEKDRNAVEPLFADISWSRSNGVNLLTWLFETGKMTGATIAEVMKDAGMDDIWKQGLSPKDTIARLTAAARVARYPELTRLQDAFAKYARELTAGSRWRLVQPNNFETGGAELSIQVKNAEQLAQAVKDLESMASLSPWQKIWQLGGKNG